MANTKNLNEKFNEYAIDRYDKDYVVRVKMYPIYENPGMDGERIIAMHTRFEDALCDIAFHMCGDYRKLAKPRGDSFEDYLKDVDNEYPFYEVGNPMLVNCYEPALTGEANESSKGYLISSHGDYFEVFSHEHLAISHWTWLQYGTWSHNHALLEKYHNFSDFIKSGERWHQYDICMVDIHIEGNYSDVIPEIYTTLGYKGMHDMDIVAQMYELERVLKSDIPLYDTLLNIRLAGNYIPMHD